MDGGRDDAPIAPDCPVLGKLPDEICTEVKTLCMQFESVVTNGSLSFNDIAFLQLNPQVASLFTLSENGGINWKPFLTTWATFHITSPKRT